MADRNLDFDPTVTNVTPKVPDTGIMTGVADVADKIAETSANAKALNATAQTALAFRQLDVAYREQTAGNPNDPNALSQLQAARSQVVAQIGTQVPAIASREYQSKTIELGQSSDKLNEFWGMHQQIRNAGSDLKTAETTQINMANMQGQEFGSSGADMGNLNAVMNFEAAQSSIKSFVTPVIGDPQTAAYLKNFSSNWVKSFVAGVAEKNPQTAATMLQRPEIAGHFSSQDVGDMADVIKKTERQQQLIQTLQTTKNDGSLADIINDPDTSYFDKRSTIDQMDAAGSISPKAAAASRRVIKDKEDVDAQTDTPAMADIINKAYDLNANASSNADDYLRGTQNLHQQVLEAQAANTLTGRDASKVTRQINDLTSKKLADATNTAGMEFYDANQKFNVLPPEYRGQATRALFYAGDGKNFTPQQYSAQADQVIQQINNQRRASAISTLGNANMSDDDFLKTIPNASPAAIKETAQKYGISEQQVVLQLRAHANDAMRAKKSGVKRVAGGDDTPDAPSSKAAEPSAPAQDNSDMEMEMNQ